MQRRLNYKETSTHDMDMYDGSSSSESAEGDESDGLSDDDPAQGLARAGGSCATKQCRVAHGAPACSDAAEQSMSVLPDDNQHDEVGSFHYERQLHGECFCVLVAEHAVVAQADQSVQGVIIIGDAHDFLVMHMTSMGKSLVGLTWSLCAASEKQHACSQGMCNA